MAQIFEEMADISSVKKAGAFVKAKEKLREAVDNVMVTRGQTVESIMGGLALHYDSVGDQLKGEDRYIFERLKGLTHPSENAIERFKEMGGDLAQARAYDDLIKSFDLHLSKYKSIKGEHNPLNAEYQDWLKGLRGFDKMSSALLRAVYANEHVKESEVPEPSVSKDPNEDLLSAFAYMGMDITKKADGSFEVKELPEGGLPYKDVNGVVQYVRISREATTSFINNYIRTGGVSYEKEERDLAEAEEILGNMKDNQKAGGIYAPSESEIAKQEKKIESIKSAIETKKSQTITPKGLFTYFVEKELIGNTSKRRLDKDVLLRAQRQFSVDAPEWEAYNLSRNPDLFLDDLRIASIAKANSATLENSGYTDLSKIPDYDEMLTSDASNTLMNRRRVGKIEAYHESVVGRAQDLADANAEMSESISDKYQDMLTSLQVRANLYTISGQRIPASLSKSIDEMQKRTEVLAQYEGLYTLVNDSLKKDKVVQARCPYVLNGELNPKLFYEEMAKHISFENGELLLNDDLVDAGGVAWFTKDDFSNLMSGEMEKSAEQEEPQSGAGNTPQGNQNRGANVNNVDMLPDVGPYALGVALPNNMTFESAMEAYAMQDRAITMLEDGNNFVADLYNGFKASGKTADEFMDAIQAQVGTNGLGSLAGVCDTNTIKNVFNYYQQKEAGASKTPPTEVSIKDTAGTNAIYENAKKAYYYMDVVSNNIFSNPALRNIYENGTEDEKRNLFENTFEQLKANGLLSTTPSEEQLKDAEARWGHYYNLGSTEKLANEMSGDIGNPNCQKILSSLAKNASKNEKLLETETARLEAEGKPVVDYAMENVQEQEQEQGDAAKKLIQFKELYPRGTPQFKISKELQPFNIKAGLKFLDQIMEAFNKVLVEDPWAKADAVSNYDVENIVKNTLDNENSNDDSAQKTDDEAQMGADGTAPNAPQPPENSEPKATEPQATEPKTAEASQGNPMFDGLSDDQVRARTAMMAVGMGVESILGKLDLGKENIDAEQLMIAINYMNHADVEHQPKVDLDGQTICTTDAMQKILLEYATGKSKEECVGRINAITDQISGAGNDNLKYLAENLNSINIVMGLLTPAELVNMLSTTAEMSPAKEGEPMTIELGSKLTPEDIEVFRKTKDPRQIQDLIEQSGMYDQATIDRIFEAGKEMKNPEAGVEITR